MPELNISKLFNNGKNKGFYYTVSDEQIAEHRKKVLRKFFTGLNLHKSLFIKYKQP